MGVLHASVARVRLGERMTEPIAVAILAPESRIRQQVRAWLEAAGDMVVVAEAADRETALEQIRAGGAEVLLADLAALGEGAEMVRVWGDLQQVRLIVLHSVADAPRVLEVLRLGAIGHLVLETLQPDEVASAVRAAHRRQAYLSPTVAGWIAEQVVRRLRARRHAP